jgi:hypothetical protein
MLRDLAAANASAESQAANDDDESTSEVQVDFRAIGNAADIPDQYCVYLRSNFPHIKSIPDDTINEFGRIIFDAGTVEIDSQWRFTIDDVRAWNVYDDDNLARAITPGHCRGDAYKAIKKAIREYSIKRELTEDQEDDIVVYSFLMQYSDTPIYNLNKIFMLEKEGCVVLDIDSCCFDPNRAGGDTLHMNVSAMSNGESLVEKIFGDVLRVELIGRFEHVSSEREDETDSGDSDDDDEGEDITIEAEDDAKSSDEDDDSDDSFIVSDDDDEEMAPSRTTKH